MRVSLVFVALVALMACTVAVSARRPHDRILPQFRGEFDAQVTDDPPIPPVISESYTAGVIVNHFPWSLAEPSAVEPQAEMWALDFGNERRLTVVNDSTFDLFVLQFYNIPSPIQYDYVIAPGEECFSQNLTDKFGPMFNWLSSSTWVNYSVIDGLVAATWSVASATERIVLFTYGPVPVRFVVESSTDQATTILDWFQFSPQVPPAADFNIPSFCSTESAPQAKPNKPRRRTHRGSAIAHKLHSTVRRVMKHRA